MLANAPFQSELHGLGRQHRWWKIELVDISRLLWTYVNAIGHKQ
jgi:hypothetical protein